MGKILTIGILGGMGPQATNHLCARITKLTSASSDQDHIPVITFNNPFIPNRVEAILNGGPSPVTELVRTARSLEHAGANFLIMPCNSAHYFIEEIRSGVAIPVLDMIEHTVQCLIDAPKGAKTVGILATTATIEVDLYSKRLEKAGFNLLTPSQQSQDLVMQAIYGRYGIKAGVIDEPARMLQDVAEELLSTGADVILAGCSEVSLAFTSRELEFRLIDPVEIIALTAIERALQGRRYASHS